MDRVDGSAPLTTNFHIGRRAPAYCTAVGKVILAEISEDELERRASSNIFQSFTHNTITSLPELKAQLAIIRSKVLQWIIRSTMLRLDALLQP